jgi:hypothetical protein
MLAAVNSLLVMAGLIPAIHAFAVAQLVGVDVPKMAGHEGLN